MNSNEETKEAQNTAQAPEETGLEGAAPVSADKKAKKDEKKEDKKEEKKEKKAKKEADKKDEKDAKIAELSDQLMRTMAEYDNFRKRTQKEKEALYITASCDAVTTLLPVLDNLERAAEAAKTAKEVGAVAEGIDMVLKQFKEAFDALSVEEIPAVGEEFDPLLHNAVMHIDDESVAANIVVEQFQKGYRLKDKVLRHSMVKVCN